jgi:tetratricopeptide (TPR) repeat protein
LAKEPNELVAESLGISLRHLYRERIAALVAIMSHIVDGESKELLTATVVRDPVAVQLALARSLEQNGQWVLAADMLERLAADSCDTSRRCMVESILANLYIDAGRYSLASKRVSCALEACSADNQAPAWLKAEAAVSAARLAVATGDVDAGIILAQSSCVELRSWIPTSRDVRVARAMIAALDVRSRAAIDCGDSRAAVQFTAEALELARQFHGSEIAVLSHARLLAAMARIIAGNPDHADNELQTCYEDAIRGGQTRHALSVAVTLASYRRVTAQPARSVALLQPLFPLASRIAFGDLLGGFFVELGSAAIDVGDIDLAFRCQAGLREVASVSPWIRAHAELLEARVELAKCRFEISLRAAETAESTFIAIGRERFVGPCLQIQSASLAALGETERAIRTLHLATERFEGSGQHYQRLIAAYLAMASLTGDRRFEIKARKLRVTLESKVSNVS